MAFIAGAVISYDLFDFLRGVRLQVAAYRLAAFVLLYCSSSEGACLSLRMPFQ